MKTIEGLSAISTNEPDSSPLMPSVNGHASPTAITAAKLWDGERLLRHPVLLIEDGHIASVSTREASGIPTNGRVLDFPGATLAPSFFDIHIHGSASHDVMEATPAALDAIGRYLASHGTANYLATTVTAPLDATLHAVSGLARLIAHPAPGRMARPIGIHLEGPFLSHAKRGVHPPADLLAPDIGVFDRLFEASERQVRLMTLAPELDGAAELAAHAISRGVRISVGHSNATAQQTEALIRAGAVSATHTFNAMRTLDHREPGILGTALTCDSLYAEIVCDGMHVAPAMVKLWWRAKGAKRAILITDALSAAGMPDGEYQLGAFAFKVEGGTATAHGVLAGSLLSLDVALSRFLKYTGAPLHDALRLSATNPATMTGLSDKAGRIAPGFPAQLIAVSEEGKLLASFVDGQLVSV
jgi:N-acetylglucosamine-6-phosphate deacetylase